MGNLCFLWCSECSLRAIYVSIMPLLLPYRTVVNQTLSYFFYPETSHRSLEEIDLIFAKGYIENISYVKAGKLLPRLSVEDMEQLAQQYGLTDSDIRKAGSNSSLDGSQAEKGVVEHVESAPEANPKPE